MRSLLTQISTTILLLLPLALAAPSECSKEIGLPGGVYLCSDKDFSGKCEWHSASDKCHNFIANRPLSIGPDAGGYCLFYEDGSCARTSGSVITEAGTLVNSKIECPGTKFARNIENKGMKCFINSDKS